MTPINWHQEHIDSRTLGQCVADRIAAVMGSWPFIISQSIALSCWITLNVVAWVHHWDVYPFILLNLMLSLQAAYAAPIIMMSQNRQAARDRAQANADYVTNVRAKEEIEALQESLSRIEIEKLDHIIDLLKGRAKK